MWKSRLALNEKSGRDYRACVHRNRHQRPLSLLLPTAVQTCPTEITGSLTIYTALNTLNDKVVPAEANDGLVKRINITGSVLTAPAEAEAT